MWTKPMQKLLAAKIADCLDGSAEGLQRLFAFYREKNLQLDAADQHFFRSLETSLREGTPFAEIFLRIGRETSKSYRKKLVNNLIFNQFIAGKAKRKALCTRDNLVPNFIVVSPTMRCNLRCTGCYSGLYSKEEELSASELDRLFAQIRGLGVYFVVISGGEPYLLKDTLLALFKKYNDMFFLTYTNGTLIDAALAERLGKLGNVAPAISVEGWEKQTDARRGKGTWRRILETMGHLRAHGVLFGASVTVTRHNLDVVTDETFARFLMDRGIIFGWYFMFMPVGKDPMLDLVMTPEQRVGCGRRVNALRETYPLFLADFWNDGEIVGGCLAAGRQYLCLEQRQRGTLRFRPFRHRQHPRQTPAGNRQFAVFQGDPQCLSLQQQRQPETTLHDHRQPRCAAQRRSSAWGLSGASGQRRPGGRSVYGAMDRRLRAPVRRTGGPGVGKDDQRSAKPLAQGRTGVSGIVSRSPAGRQQRCFPA